MLQHWSIPNLFNKYNEMKGLDEWKEEFEACVPMILLIINDGNKLHMAIFHAIVDKVIAFGIGYKNPLQIQEPH